ncbi:MAG: cyclic pyranopterin monophosphate synthase MoaC [Candidatus Krumholzibacteria bacterium]|nr:cyclic pyranopterin monophosphate synthase MoaC [Candidatus Krumholzibacteria bacterium]MDP6668766.1 cyclic pyranopterin monophosphate synthase MoaC [Candidatus Krumholzibacteria bacterium]MDP6797490.1 cyclic pyranopterin monophosphate synthase MoaC [Candidatus Krumholzibacteria bacterium]MDP7021512.1 cyclic pyranopterin monophosphate synthase MoaC [Candidatus Krumholzibacteria bacterium]
MSELSHLDPEGRARMVDVGDKKLSARMARARARVQLGQESMEALRENPKGDVFAVARIAGIQAAKRCGELIPLCHPIPLHHVSVDLHLEVESREILIESRVSCEGKTGVEMEALSAVSVSALTVYDMLKAVDKGIRIREIFLLEKSGGRSGHWQRETE